MGHARALVSAGDEATQVALYHRVVQERLSVRDIESILRGEHVSAPIVRAKDQKREKIKLSDSEYTFKNDFGDQLSTKVEITKTSNGNGKIIVNFNSEIDLSRIIDLLNSK
jgi:ParB family chromosome partitioning protein